MNTAAATGPAAGDREGRRAVAAANRLDQAFYDVASARFYARLCAELGECDFERQDSSPGSVATPPLARGAAGPEDKSGAGYPLDAGAYQLDARYELDVQLGGVAGYELDGYALDVETAASAA